MENFTPISAFLGGSILGLAAALMLLFNGRIAGISGIVSGAVSPQRGDTAWRLWFIGGLLIGPFVAMALGAEGPKAPDLPVIVLILAGLMVGLGTRLGNGCTSGHGICGMGRLSGRSFAATMTFMATAVATVFVTNHLLG